MASRSPVIGASRFILSRMNQEQLTTTDEFFNDIGTERTHRPAGRTTALRGTVDMIS
jgi:hypothetical protein